MIPTSSSASVSKTNRTPFNISLMSLKSENIKSMRSVSSHDAFEGSTKSFHPDGLFSTQTFGRTGSEYRTKVYAYIDLNIEVLHPLIYRKICELGSLYEGILQSTLYVTFDKATKNFEKSTPAEGFTGYQYFLDHFNELVFPRTKSSKRDYSIKLIDKYKSSCMMTKHIVMPAGYRDYEIDKNGKPSEDDVNGMYRKLLSLSSLITPNLPRTSLHTADVPRAKLQLAVLEIYEYFEAMLDGKHKVILGKWAARNIHHGTRNVITSLLNDYSELHGPLTVSTNQTVVGLYQYLKGTQPVSIGDIRRGFLSNVFNGPNNPASLVDKKTLKRKLVQVHSTTFDYWNTDEGLEKNIAQFGLEDVRHDFAVADDHYIGLIFKGEGTYLLLQDIDDLPEGLDKRAVTPLTYTELFYLSVEETAAVIPGTVTRYPVAALGGVYPSYTFLKTTVSGESRRELDINGDETGRVVTQFPKYQGEFVNSMSVSPSHIARLVAD